MTGFRTQKERTELFQENERVVSGSGRRGVIKKINGPQSGLYDSAIVLWDDGEEFSIKLVHLSHEERFFGGETSKVRQDLT